MQECRTIEQLKALAETLPCVTISDRDGPFVSQFLLIGTPQIRVSLNYLVRGETGPIMHGHDGECWSDVIYGWYLEDRFVAPRRVSCLLHKLGDKVSISGFHRVDDVDPGGCWTLLRQWLVANATGERNYVYLDPDTGKQHIFEPGKDPYRHSDVPAWRM